ncbi:MAG: hypothetical protein JO340_17795 [Acidobacteriaceae bacterium]|nr:hypothetical protein [Acidobacteriaceae bacterium]
MRRKCAVAVAVSALLAIVCAPARAQQGCPTPNVWPKDLTPPPPEHGGQNEAFDIKLRAYMQTGCYRTAEGWKGDSAIRGTGPYVQWNYGTHYAAVRIWYSPEVAKWLEGGRQGDIPEGAVIIKEQYQTSGLNGSLKAVPPACFEYMDPKVVTSEKFLSDWSIMIRRPGASKDGWYWVEVYKDMPFEANQYPNGGYGQYCVRCHASAEKDSTFSSLDNIQGNNYQTFYIDQSWRTNPECQPQSPAGLPQPGPRTPLAHPLPELLAQRPPGPLDDETQRPLTEEHIREFLSDHERQEALERLRKARGRAAAGTAAGCPTGVECMVPEVFDRTVSSATHPGGFVSSDQCQGCHSSTWPWMLLQTPNTQTQVGIAPYAEWRWSPMGLAGRDPIFYAQVESELAYIATLQEPQRTEFAEKVKNTCFHCHGVMGQREFAQEHPKETFDPGVVNKKDNVYGSLARDGVSCTACHRIKDDYASLDDFLKTKTTGNFDLIADDQIQGPFGDDHIVVDPMKNSLGYTPKYNAYTTSSRLCGSCHVIDLPVIDHPTAEHSLEQNTYVEWLNSQYENEFSKNNPKARTCQDCHMRDSYSNLQNKLNVSPLPTKIAVVEDEDYPGTTHRLPLDKIKTTFRSTGFRRHDLLGANGFLLQMFLGNMATAPDGNNYNDILGVRQSDYMSGLTTDLPNAIENLVEQAQQNTATASVNVVKAAGQQLVADVTVQNLTGHRFPSGVGFRRVFIQVQVTDTSGKVVWSSGGTNSKGEIVGPDGNVLPTEYFNVGRDGKQQYQPHFDQQHPITQQTQVQIYEELLQDADGKITTSFLRRDTDLKDNRLLPIGWRENAPIPEFYLHATYPVGGARQDPVYKNGQGQSVVRYAIQLPGGTDAATARVNATVYYQSIPPYFLRQRFEGAPNGPGTQRLKYLVDTLKLNGTSFENWKLMVAQTAPNTNQGAVARLRSKRHDVEMNR